MTDQTNKLEPCPFCGPGESVVAAYIDDTVSRWRVGCGRCGCSTGFHPTDKTRASAIAAWNRRASAPAAEELKRLVDNCIFAAAGKVDCGSAARTKAFAAIDRLFASAPAAPMVDMVPPAPQEEQ